MIEALRLFYKFTKDVKLLLDKTNPDEALPFTNLFTHNRTLYFYVPKFSFNDVTMKNAVSSCCEMKHSTVVDEKPCCVYIKGA